MIQQQSKEEIDKLMEIAQKETVEEEALVAKSNFVLIIDHGAVVFPPKGIKIFISDEVGYLRKDNDKQMIDVKTKLETVINLIKEKYLDKFGGAERKIKEAMEKGMGVEGVSKYIYLKIDERVYDLQFTYLSPEDPAIFLHQIELDIISILGM
jgi:hypothetical protein